MAERLAEHRSSRDPKDLPSSVSEHVSLFDRFANGAATVVARAWFFAFCLLLIIVWAPSYFVFGNLDTWQLVINTATTIITFLLVALLQNSQRRADEATQHKLNALALAVSDFMASMAHEHSKAEDLHNDRRELLRAVGIEHQESA